MWTWRFACLHCQRSTQRRGHFFLSYSSPLPTIIFLQEYPPPLDILPGYMHCMAAQPMIDRLTLGLCQLVEKRRVTMYINIIFFFFFLSLFSVFVACSMVYCCLSLSFPLSFFRLSVSSLIPIKSRAFCTLLPLSTLSYISFLFLSSHYIKVSKQIPANP